MAEEKKIATGYIGNALRSSAADHTTTFADEIFDTERQQYQSGINRDLEQSIDAETARAKAAEEAIIYDVSSHNDGAVFESLSALLSSSNLDALIPASVRHGGMTIRFIQGSEQSSDNKYVQYRLTADEWSTNTENWTIAEEGAYVENPEFVYVKTDSEGKTLYGVKTDGKFYFGDGCPPQVREYIITNFVIKESGKSLINADFALSQNVIENTEFLEAKVDSEEKILEAITNKGVKVINIPINLPSAIRESISNAEWLQLTTDKDGKILEGIKRDGSKYIGIYTDLDRKVDKIEGKGLSTNDYSDEDKGKLDLIDSLPDYYKDYIANKITQINNSYYKSIQKNDIFAFISDVHIVANHKKSGILIKYLFEHSILNKCFFGGDVCSVQNSQSVKTELELYNKYIVGPIKSSGDFYAAKGNHDFYNRLDGLGKNAPYYTFMQSNNHRMVKNESDTIGCYYYVDNPIGQIRYIVYDSHYDVIGSQNVSNTQLKWLVEQAFMTTPDNWNVILMGHVPFVPLCDKEKENTEGSQAGHLDGLLTLCRAAKNHLSNIELAGSTYDFSAFKGNLLACISGHEHQDIQTYVDGLLYVTIGCDTGYSMVSPFCNHLYKVANTTNEQCFDVVNVLGELNALEFIRIGLGYNRIYNLTKNEVNIGETIQLTPSITPISWTSNDSEASENNEWDIENNVWKYSSEVCSVDLNGLVTANAAGEAFVFAEDAEHNKEFFYIKVNN